MRNVRAITTKCFQVPGAVKGQVSETYRKDGNPSTGFFHLSSFVCSIEHVRSRKIASENMIHPTFTQACSIETVALTQLSTPLGMSKGEAGH